MNWLAFFVLLHLLTAVTAGWFATKLGRSGWQWGLLCFYLFGPFALMVLLTLEPAAQAPRRYSWVPIWLMVMTATACVFLFSMIATYYRAMVDPGLPMPEFEAPPESGDPNLLDWLSWVGELGVDVTARVFIGGLNFFDELFVALLGVLLGCYVAPFIAFTLAQIADEF